MLRSDLCDFSDAYIALKGTIIIKGGNNQDIKKRYLTLKTMLHLLAVSQRSIMY